MKLLILKNFSFNVCIAVDHLVNNAGVTSVSLFEEIEDITNMRSIMVIASNPSILDYLSNINFDQRFKIYFSKPH